MEFFGKLDSWKLRMLATFSMVIDHAAVAFLQKEGIMYTIFRSIGRLAFPVFVFLLVEGYRHTANKRRYALRILILAAISELPYQMLFNGKISFLAQNTVFTLFICFTELYIIDKLTVSFSLKGIRKSKVIGAVIGLIISCAATYIMKSDYAITGPVLTAVYYFSSGNVTAKCALASASMLLYPAPVQAAGCIGSIFPIITYNGAKGKGLKWFGYIFYPAHLIIILLLKIINFKFVP